MTPARKAALQWFHDRGEVREVWSENDAPSDVMVRMMLADETLRWTARNGYFLTDKGRRALHGDAT